MVIVHQYLQKLFISNKHNTVTRSVNSLATVSKLEPGWNFCDLIPSADVLQKDKMMKLCNRTENADNFVAKKLL